VRSTSLAFICLVVATAAAEPRDKSNGLLAEINYPEGQARLPEATSGQLRRIAAWADDNFDGYVVIDGHADRSGPDAGNTKLALKRARIVRDQLLALGVDPSQLTITAFGSEDRPKARVAVWGTREQSIGKRKTEKKQKVYARPSPAGQHRR
jgi:outer membrane protein OmpA-like peptidoglycan-associated protein